MQPYVAAFEVGSTVRIAELKFLVDFRDRWKYHHPLEPEQLNYAGQVARVKSVGFYHGGDPLYVLSDVPGVWHEECLRKS